VRLRLIVYGIEIGEVLFITFGHDLLFSRITKSNKQRVYCKNWTTKHG